MKEILWTLFVILVSTYATQSDIERELKDKGTYSLIFSSGIIKGTIVEPTYNLEEK